MFVKVLETAPSAASNSAPAAGEKKKITFRMTIPLNGLFIDASSRASLDLEIGAIALTQDKKGLKEAAEFIQPVKGNPKPENRPDVGQGRNQLPTTTRPASRLLRLRFFARDNNYRPHRHRRLPPRSEMTSRSRCLTFNFVILSLTTMPRVKRF